jgi:ParB-like chromosome segregation protein Spo0J
MQLLETSIVEDGYTQPLVTWVKEDRTREVVDGFHRNLVGKTSELVQKRVRGYLPVATINETQSQKSDRMASTIRHNRARGTHNIELMSTIVAELVEMGKGDRWICQHIGMSVDELLRLKQITGVAALFANREFSESWEPDIDQLSQFDAKIFESSVEGD